MPAYRVQPRPVSVPENADMKITNCILEVLRKPLSIHENCFHPGNKLPLERKITVIGMTFNVNFSFPRGDSMPLCVYVNEYVQRPPSSQSRGFEVRVLESSHGWLASTVVSYCPSRTSELQPTVITKHSD